MTWHASQKLPIQELWGKKVWTNLDKIENKLGKTCEIQIKSYQFRNCKQNEKIEKIEEKLIEK